MPEQTVDLAELVWHLDEPLADLSALGFLALSELAARHVTVALSGQGADEFLGGYGKHRAAAHRRRVEPPAGPGRARRARRWRCVARTFPTRGADARRAEPVDRLLAMSGRLDATLGERLVRGQLASCDGGRGAARRRRRA